MIALLDRLLHLLRKQGWRELAIAAERASQIREVIAVLNRDSLAG